VASAWRAEPDAAEGNTSSAWLHAGLRQEQLPHTMEDVMRFGRFKFGSVQIDGVTYEYDVVIDGGSIRKRKKKPSKPFRNAYGHTPLSAAEDIPGTAGGWWSVREPTALCRSWRRSSARLRHVRLNSSRSDGSRDRRAGEERQGNERHSARDMLTAHLPEGHDDPRTALGYSAR
jgi:hypothetical protein